MSDEILIIKLKNDAKTFKIDQLQNFTIKTDIFIPKEENAGLYGSYNNWLIFDYLNRNYHYQFIIDSFYKFNQLKELIIGWKDKDNFTLIEEKLWKDSLNKF